MSEIRKDLLRYIRYILRIAYVADIESDFSSGLLQSAHCFLCGIRIARCDKGNIRSAGCKLFSNGSSYSSCSARYDGNLSIKHI